MSPAKITTCEKFCLFCPSTAVKLNFNFIVCLGQLKLYYYIQPFGVRLYTYSTVIGVWIDLVYFNIYKCSRTKLDFNNSKVIFISRSITTSPVLNSLNSRNSFKNLFYWCINVEYMRYRCHDLLSINWID
jgi:hypothetical protein